MKAMWKGEDGAPDAITVGPFVLGPAIAVPAATFFAGKPVDVSAEMAAALLGNPFFDIIPDPVAPPAPARDDDGRGNGGKAK